MCDCVPVASVTDHSKDSKYMIISVVPAVSRDTSFVDNDDRACPTGTSQARESERAILGNDGCLQVAKM